MSEATPTSRILYGALVPLPGVYALDPVHTFVDFVSQHLVVGRVRGRFDDVSGKATVADDPRQSSLEVAIKAASLSTHNAVRDADLRSARFFDVEAFPTITFHSHKIVAELANHWTVEGPLTIRNVTHPVSFSLSIAGIVVDPWGATRVGIHARAQASRKDFGLLADLERETGGMLPGTDVMISFEAEALLQT
jgi:polyisoprenoid-binding protein YceI